MEPWKKNLYVMLAVQFTMFVLFTSVFSYMPLFIMELGISGQDRVAFWSGLISSISSLFAALSSPIWGRWSDRTGYKNNLLRSCVAVVLFNFLSGLSTNVYQLMVFRILQGCFSGFAAASVSMVGAGTPALSLGFALGWLQTAQVLGAMVGPMVGGALADLFSYRQVFFIASGLGLVATALALALLDEPGLKKSERPAPLTHALAGLPAVSRRAILAMLVVLFCAQFGTRCVEPILSLHVINLGQSPSSVGTLTGILFTAAALGQLLAITLFVKQISSWGHKRVLQTTLLGAGLLYFPHILVGKVWPLVALRLGVGAFLGAVIPTANALVGSLVPPSRRGAVYGLTTSALFLGSFLSVLGSGVLAALLGIPAVFLAAGGLLFLAAAWVWITVPGGEDKGDGEHVN